jgi:hypothetical protein
LVHGIQGNLDRRDCNPSGTRRRASAGHSVRGAPTPRNTHASDLVSAHLVEFRPPGRPRPATDTPREERVLACKVWSRWSAGRVQIRNSPSDMQYTTTL